MDRLLEGQSQARNSVRKTLKEVVAMETTKTGTLQEAMLSSILTIYEDLPYGIHDKDCIIAATITWNLEDPKANQLRVNRGRHGSTEKHALEWRTYLSTKPDVNISETIRSEMVQWSNEICTARFISFCKLIKQKDETGDSFKSTIGVRQKRIRLSKHTVDEADKDDIEGGVKEGEGNESSDKEDDWEEIDGEESS